MSWTAPQTWVTGQVVTASELNTDIRDNMNHVYGTVGTFSPTVTQSGSVTLTTATGRYRHVGNTCYLHVAIDFGGNGTGLNDITVGNIPTAIAPKTSGDIGSGTANNDLGRGIFLDSGTAVYPLICFFASSSTLKFMEANTAAFFLGTVPNFAIAAADSLNFTITYETSAVST